MKKLSYKIQSFLKNQYLLILLLVVLIFQLFGFVYINIYPVYQLKNSVDELNRGLTYQNLEKWLKAYAIVSTDSPPLSEEMNKNALIYSFINYIQSLDENNKKIFIELPTLDVISIEEYDREIDPPIEYITSNRIPQGERVIADNGEKYLQNETHVIFENGTLIVVGNIEDVKSPKKVLYGNLPREQFRADLTNELLAIQNETEILTDYFDETVRGSDTLKKLKFQDLNLDFNQDEKVISGEISLIDTKCASNYNLKYGYQIDIDRYTIYDLTNLELKDCSVVQSFSQPKETKMLTCSDCKYAPVDKTYFLPSTYAPSLVSTNLPGGGYLTSETVVALNQIAVELKKQDVNVYVTSAFRSYQQQQEAFNYWVNRELATGLDLQTARAKANIYSAFPGHSEHQLGTTLDIRCEDCSAFSKDVASNPVYQFLQEHAHKYGFVISYPAGKQHLTGYTYEPWHIRYIGVELATELFNRNYQSSTNSEYLTKFLIEKGMY
ncbi:MAG TPA: M15 family metallopeptidase [Candidatus Dojkabacteria bacterium]|nr:M15 family metallopeptidase [Candidatus Dojkabacteria bacterium]